MFLKIKVRSELLRIFRKVGFGGNAHSADPLCNYLYYDHLNTWLPIFQKYGDIEGENTAEIVAKLLLYASSGYCPEKYEEFKGKQEKSKEAFVAFDIVDEDIKHHIKQLDTHDVLTAFCGLSVQSSLGLR
jgi:hypothetical protein